MQTKRKYVISGDGMTHKMLMSRERWEMHWRNLELAPTIEAKREAAKEYHDEMERLMKAAYQESITTEHQTTSAPST